ncbi:hypothetical protein HNQ02_000711 [Flavobacterium sp. 7E]|uniref:hypothetical protein n=1 Tax=Flavobacterium sp. 7E TaxID=2735898 RepID=UPI00156D687C|nr:hypothetical protein [Flavobacterium sp. 7E]NRS87804.1 hypothetical protein [Flavobacterium sp. 7E]
MISIRIRAYLLSLLSTILLSSCGQQKKVPTSNDLPIENSNIKVTGIVQKIQLGKDGYTALLKTPQNEIYYITISHANLSNPNQYKNAKVGDSMSVKGNFWQMEKEKHLMVREILP